jgi:sugar/nucleoside kinase (ribokinase family)
LTSYASDFVPNMAPARVTIERLQSAETTTFENIYHDGLRTQFVRGCAKRLGPHDVPAGWKRTPIVHLAPIAGELETALVHCFANSLIGLTPQGWMREWDAEGRVRPSYWEEAQAVMPWAAAVVLSDEDVADTAWIDRFRRWARLLVVTHGATGCTVFMGDEERHIPAPAAREINPTGAGDIFATAFFVRLYQTKGNPWEAARFANELAATSVTGQNLATKIHRLQAVLQE